MELLQNNNIRYVIVFRQFFSFLFCVESGSDAKSAVFFARLTVNPAFQVNPCSETVVKYFIFH